MRMPMNLKQCVWILAVVLSMGIAGGSLRAAVPPSPQDQGREQDYSKNKKYQQGCAKARMTVSVTLTTPRRGASKKTKIKELTSQATSKGTRSINIDKSLRELSRALWHVVRLLRRC